MLLYIESGLWDKMSDSNTERNKDFFEFRKTLSIIESHSSTLVLDTIDFQPQSEGLPSIDKQIKKSNTLGTGGIGIVFSADQPNLERIVAIKQLKVAPNRGDYARLLEHEAKITGRLEHPNILPVYMYGQIAGQPTMVMKRLEGETWDHHLSKSPCSQSMTELVSAIRIIQEVGKAVAYAHSYKIIHRDIKPENIHLGRHGEVFLLDWGLAIELGKTNIFPEKALVGTPAYMPPEMAKSESDKQSEATDVYLLGATLYEAIFNQSPHQGSSISEILENIRTTKKINIPKNIPEVLRSLLNRALAFEPENRYARVSDLLEALEQVKSTLQNLPFIRNIERQCEIIQYAITNELRDWQESIESMLFSYSALCEDYYARTLELEVQKTVVMAIELEITLQRYSSARRFITKLPKPNQKLENHLDEVESQTLAKLENYAEWKNQNNPSTGLVYRLSASSILMVVWGSIAWILHSVPQFGYKSSWGWGITLLVFVIFNKGFRLTKHNKNIAWAICMLVLCTVSAAIITPMLEIDFAVRMAFVQMSYGIALGLMAILISSVFWMASIPFWISAFLVAAYPEHNDTWTAMSKSLAFGGMSLFWYVQNPRSVKWTK